MRRVVTGLGKEGKSVFVSDGEPPRSCAIEQLPSFRIMMLICDNSTAVESIHTDRPSVEVEENA